MGHLPVTLPLTTTSPTSVEEPAMPSSEEANNEASPSGDEACLPPLPQPLRVGEERESKNKKRKRTSPEDHKILEQEYKKNPKPDKKARMQIFEQVKLTEKEVQIWFQNKRQSSRRKSRPLLPHEIAALLSSDPISSSPHGSSQPMSPEKHVRSDASDVSVVEPAAETLERNPLPNEHRPVELKEKSIFLVEDELCVSSQPSNTLDNTCGLEVPAQPELPPDTIPQSHQGVQMDLNQPHIRASSPGISRMHTPISSQLEALSCCSENLESSEGRVLSSSRMRLSLSLEGRAELEEASPPRTSCLSSFDLGAAPRRPRGLRRSQSAVPLGLSSYKQPAFHRIPWPTTGRSRDARAWEFYADNGIQNEPGLPIEHHDPSGSAVAAISLIRSASNNNNNDGIASTANQSKRSAAPAKASDSKAVKKPKLARASSSFPRLQGSHIADSLKPRIFKQPSKLPDSPMGDSDKENWVSGETGSERRRTASTKGQGTKQERRRVLGESANVPMLPAKQTAEKSRKRKSDEEPTIIFEDEIKEENIDPEVERFMRGNLSPSKRGDLDCVQGLLSLSQGNWR